MVFLMVCLLLVYTAEIIHKRWFVFYIFSVNLYNKLLFWLILVSAYLMSTLTAFINRTTSLYKEQCFQLKYSPSWSLLQLGVVMWHSSKQWHRRRCWRWGWGLLRKLLKGQTQLACYFWPFPSSSCLLCICDVLGVRGAAATHMDRGIEDPES